MSFPYYNFIAFDSRGNYGWVHGLGKFSRNPFRNDRGMAITPADIGFAILSSGMETTAWERVFDNGRVLVTDLEGLTHRYGSQARITYLSLDGEVLAEYFTDELGTIERLQRA